MLDRMTSRIPGPSAPLQMRMSFCADDQQVIEALQPGTAMLLGVGRAGDRFPPPGGLPGGRRLGRVFLEVGQGHRSTQHDRGRRGDGEPCQHGDHDLESVHELNIRQTDLAVPNMWGSCEKPLPS